MSGGRQQHRMPGGELGPRQPDQALGSWSSDDCVLSASRTKLAVGLDFTQFPRPMTSSRFDELTSRYAALRLAVVGDFCLDRYLEIDPARAEVSIETGLPVHNVLRVRSQPGGAGTVLNNLVALGVGRIFPIGFHGDDGEGYELRRALAGMAGVRLDYFSQTLTRDTFTYCKPLIIEAGKPPRELNRLDRKNWTPTPPSLGERLAEAVRMIGSQVDALVALSQVDLPGTGVLAPAVLAALGELSQAHPDKLILADSRHGLAGFPPLSFKLNASELTAFLGLPSDLEPAGLISATTNLARRNQRTVFVTLAERGILAVAKNGEHELLHALPTRGPIDVVGAGDAVSANLTCALAAGATLREALVLANAAASVVLHQLGTTGTASIAQLREVVV